MSDAPREARTATRSLRFCDAGELGPGSVLSRVVGGRSVAVARLADGRLCAFSALCPHQHADLSLGLLEAGSITCADHLWRFELPSGACSSIPGARLPVFGVREEAGAIFVELPS